MEKNTKNVVLLIVGVLVVMGILFFFMWQQENVPGKYDDLATCISNSGAKFYGAFWCSHCQNQKAMFGNSAKKLPYIECSTPNGKSQLPVCDEAGVSNYPTWKFADGTTQEGEVSLQVLAAKTNCTIPQ